MLNRKIEFFLTEHFAKWYHEEHPNLTQIWISIMIGTPYWIQNWLESNVSLIILAPKNILFFLLIKMVSKWAFVRWDIFVMRNKRVLGYLHIILFFHGSSLFFTSLSYSLAPPMKKWLLA